MAPSLFSHGAGVSLCRGRGEGETECHTGVPALSKNAARRRRFCLTGAVLQRRFNLKTPGFEQSLRDIFGIFVAPRPLPQTGGPDELVRGQLELLCDLLEGGDCGYNRANGLWFAPIRISTTLCHRFCVLERIILPVTSSDGVGKLIEPEELCVLFYGYFIEKSIGKRDLTVGWGGFAATRNYAYISLITIRLIESVRPFQRSRTAQALQAAGGTPGKAGRILL